MKKDTMRRKQKTFRTARNIASALLTAVGFLNVQPQVHADVASMIGSGSLGWDLGYGNPPWSDSLTLLESRARTIGQVIGLGCVRIGLDISDLQANSITYPERLDNYVIACHAGGIEPVILINYFKTYNASNPTELNRYDWYAAGNAVANRFRPGSSWNVGKGFGNNWGCRVYLAFNEPANFTPNIDKTAYRNALKAFADGVHAASSSLKAINGGHLVAEFTFANATSDLFNNGTLNGLCHHPYVQSIGYGGGPYQGSPQVHMDWIKQNSTIGDVDNYMDESNYWKPNTTMSQDEAAKYRMTHYWGALGVAKANGAPATRLWLAWNPMHHDQDNSSVESYALGLCTSFEPNWTANPGGRVLQMIARLTKGMNIVSTTPKTTGEVILTGSGKKMWVWHNRNGWGNKTGTSYTVSDIPPGSTTLKVFRYNSWTQIPGGSGTEAPHATVNLTGQQSYTFTGLPTEETFMFVAAIPPVVNGAIYRLTPRVNTGSCMEVAGTGTANGTQVQEWAWSGATKQKWKITDAGNGSYRLAPQHATGSSLDVNGAASVNGTKIQIWTANSSAAQQWKIYDMGGGWSRLSPNCAPSSCLDVAGAGTANGTLVHLWQDNGGDAQRWRLQPVLPSPWTSADVGTVGVAGSSHHDGASLFTLRGSGADIWDTADAFQYCYQSSSGDCEIRAKVTSQTNTDPWAKAGVMIRETSAAGGKYALMGVTPGNGFDFQYRSATGGTSGYVSGGALNAAPNNWVRLVRSGSTITAYKSANGSTWTTVGSVTISMTSGATIGLAVTSHNNSTLGQVTFSNVTAVP